MTAPVPQAATSLAWAFTGNRSIAFPATVNAGDLILLQIGVFSVTPDTPSGPAGAFTPIRNDTTNGGSGGAPIKSYLYSYVADGTEGGTNLSITGNGGSNWYYAAGMLRISGANTTSPVNAQAAAVGTNGDTTPDFANTITPNVADTLLCFFYANGDSDTAVGGYSIDNNNPTWSEQYELLWGAEDYTISMATGVYTATTATGNSHVTGALSTSRSLGQMLAIAPGAGGPANVKTVGGLALASVKTVGGLAIASVKTIGGLN